MAELQLAVRYRTPVTVAGLTTVVAAAPIWSLAAPALFGLVISYVCQNPAAAPTYFVVGLCLTLLSIFALGLMLAALFEDDRIQVSKDGLAIPLLLMGMRFRRNFLWSELKSATLVDVEDNMADTKLCLTFGNTMPIQLRLSAIKKDELEQLLMATELWGTNCTRGPELIGYQACLKAESRESGNMSYTQMWEEELGRRFSNTSFMPLEPGHTLQNGKLKVIRQLAFGGFSAIYLAQLNKLDLVVLKEAVVPASVNEDARRTAELHLERESRFLAALHHPNIVRVMDYFVEEGRHYMVLEQIAGQDIRQYVKQNGAQSEAVVIDWASQLTDILTYLHTQDPPLVHRDLTPDNIVLRNDGKLMLIDFGASNQFVGTATGTLIGKQAYIAPEQLRGKAVTQSDIYALGGTLYFALTGKEPIPLMVAHPRQVVGETSEEFDQIIASCTELEVADRAATASEVHERLKHLQNRELAASLTASPSDAV